MRQAFGCVARLIALVCAILFIVSATLALLLFDVDRRLGHPEVYKRALADSRIYERLPSLAAEMMERGAFYNPCVENPEQEACKLEGEAPLPTEHPLYPVFASSSPQMQVCLRQALGKESFRALASGKRVLKSAEFQQIKPCLRQFGVPVRSNTGGPPVWMWMLDRSDWEAIFAALLPAAWLQAQVESVIDQVFGYLDAKTDVVKFSLVEFKKRLAGDAGVTILTRIIQAQPPCALDQLANMVGSATAMEKIELCRPPEGSFDPKNPEVRQAISQALANFPDEATLISGAPNPPPSSPEDSLLGSDARTAFGRVRLFLRIGVLLPIAFFLLMTLFGVRSLRGLLRWWGIPLLVVGLVVGSFAVLGFLGVDRVFSILVPVDRMLAMGMTTNLIQAIQEIGHNLARSFATFLGIEAGIVFGIGLTLVIGSLFFGRKRAFSGNT